MTEVPPGSWAVMTWTLEEFIGALDGPVKSSITVAHTPGAENEIKIHRIGQIYEKEQGREERGLSTRFANHLNDLLDGEREEVRSTELVHSDHLPDDSLRNKQRRKSEFKKRRKEQKM